MFTDAEKSQFLAEARQNTQGTSQSINEYLANKARSIGMSMEDAERGMGWQPGSLSSVQPQSANLGMGTSVAQGPAVSSGVTPLSAADRDAWRGRFDSQAAASGRTAGDHMYDYARQNNLSNADVDRYMGYNSGTSDSWVAANKAPGQNATIAGNNTQTVPSGPSQNLGMGGAGGGAAGGGDLWLEPAGRGSLTGDGGGGVNMSPGGSPMPTNSRPPASTGDTTYQRNPYLDQSARDVGSQMFDQWSRNVAPNIRSGAMQAGGYGGSRQGVVEANSINDMQRNYSQALTGMYGQDYTNAQNRGIQRQGQAQSYNLGLGSLANQWQGQAQNYDLGLRNNDLGFGQLDYQINQGNFNNNLAAANFGLGVQNQLNQNNQTGIAAGTQIQNTPLDYQKYLNASNTAYGNAGGTRNGTTTT